MLNKMIAQAMDYHAQGFNCAQSVALPFCGTLAPLDQALVKRGLEGFGAGMGGTAQTCGALSGAVFVAGLVHADATEPTTKQATYAVCRKMSEEFVAQCGSGICAEIKGLSTGKPLCSCDDCIKLGVRLALEARE